MRSCLALNAVADFVPCSVGLLLEPFLENMQYGRFTVCFLVHGGSAQTFVCLLSPRFRSVLLPFAASPLFLSILRSCSPCL
jgi:hypothetical protein